MKQIEEDIITKQDNKSSENLSLKSPLVFISHDTRDAELAELSIKKSYRRI